MDLTHSFEDNYINDLIQHQVFSSIYLKNGIRLKGRLIGHDEMCVFLKATETQTIHKSRISTITPCDKKSSG
jgi:RNA chaperone Hfq